MKGHVREIKREAEALVSDGEIEEFSIETTGRHPKLRFKVRGGWHSVPFASSPRSPFTNNFTRQQIRRVIRSL